MFLPFSSTFGKNESGKLVLDHKEKRRKLNHLGPLIFLDSDCHHLSKPSSMTQLPATPSNIPVTLHHPHFYFLHNNNHYL